MYEKMKTAARTNYRELSYFSEIMTALCSMFEWTTPQGANPDQLEKWLHTGGNFGAALVNGVWHYAESAGRVGELSEMNEGREIQFTPVNGQTITGTPESGVFICYNNSMRAPDWDVISYSDQWAQIDKAVYSITRWAGVSPIVTAQDDQTAAAINAIVSQIMAGDLKCITSENIRALLSGSGDTLGVVHLTDPTRAQSAQYLAELYDVLQRRLYNKYGVSIQNSDKRAQASADEVHGYDNLACIVPDNMLKARRVFCDQANKYAGAEVWAVDFSPAWKHTHQAAEVDESEVSENGESMGET